MSNVHNKHVSSGSVCQRISKDCQKRGKALFLAGVLRNPAMPCSRGDVIDKHTLTSKS